MLFVLAIGSLIGLMSTWFVQDMISSSSQIRDFYQSYYIAKWGLELGTLAVNRYEYGFEDILSWSQDIINNNLNCQKNCNLDISIQSRIKEKNLINSNLESIKTCNFNTPYPFILSQAQSYIIPLFADQRKLSNTSLTKSSIINILTDYNINISTDNNNENTLLGIGIVLGSGNQAIYNALPVNQQQKLFITGTIAEGTTSFNIYNFLTTPKAVDSTQPFQWNSIKSQYTTNPSVDNDDYFNYLYITNLSSDQDFKFCLNIERSQNGYISDKSIVTALSTYGDTTLWLQAQVKKPLLEYIVRPWTSTTPQ